MPQQAASGNVSWPWLHETYYLQAGESDWGTIDDHAAVLSASTNDANPADYTALPDTAWPISPQPGQADYANTQLVTGPDATSGPDCASRIQSSTEALVSLATSAAFSPNRAGMPKHEWHGATQELATLLQSEQTSSARICEEDDWILHHFLGLYMDNFNPLWPMVSKWRFDIERFHPILFLTMASIGAMYGTDNSRIFGSSMHQRLRRLLAAALFDLEGPDGDLAWLAQARVLTQVHALYFGQRKAFSYAQHLGSILVAQARRMNLFQESRLAKDRWPCNDTTASQDRCTRWMSQEARRRLAYGIMRADVYTSVLLDTRPFLSPDEIRLTLPRGNNIWHNSQQFSPAELSIAQQMEDDRTSPLLTCDAVSIAMDPAERLPDLDAVGYETLMFGFQDCIWRFAHDPELFQRLTGRGKTTCSDIDTHSSPPTETNAFRHWTEGTEDSAESARFNDEQTSTQGAADHVGQLHRRMSALKSAADQLCEVLADWERRVTAARLSRHFAQNRDTLMSSLLLYHLSMLRLNTPLQDLHHVAYGASGVHDLDWSVTQTVRTWCDSGRAKVATRHALSIWTLIRQELRRASGERAKFNLLGFLSLHPSAVVLWAAAQTQDLEQYRQLRSCAGDSLVNARDILEDFARLFDGLGPLGGSSFKLAALRLSVQRFPSPIGNG
ncbi:hypothetical protein LTR53_003639 [Teratosphaeriaceae sp. CCFEE 6253]|nr:hypothetical protein LTR53_003639 [Teratosphaeriaceae sp. CCFEE 6253]